jgi:hypothetical protein
MNVRRDRDGPSDTDPADRRLEELAETGAAK